jgi:hypothetical protein
MSGRQLDLFSAAGLPAADETAAQVEPCRVAPSDLDDSALVVALPEAQVVDCHALCAEAGRRRLTAAIPALEALCRRFKGFGLEHAVPEQIAAAITFSSSIEMLLRLADRLADVEVVFGSESILSKEHLALAQASQTIQSYGFGDALIDQKALVENCPALCDHRSWSRQRRDDCLDRYARSIRARPSGRQGSRRPTQQP